MYANYVLENVSQLQKTLLENLRLTVENTVVEVEGGAMWWQQSPWSEILSGLAGLLIGGGVVFRFKKTTVVGDSVTQRGIKAGGDVVGRDKVGSNNQPPNAS